MKALWIAALALAACDRAPSVRYDPVNFRAGDELVVAYDCDGVKAGTRLVFSSMDGTDVQAWADEGQMVILDRRCVVRA